MVLDTNVVVSAVISDSESRVLLKKGIENQFFMVTSDLILKEIATVLRRAKFKTAEDEIRRVVVALIRSSEVVTVKSNYDFVKDDSKDNIIINTAYDGNADFIVTGDKHLLKLKEFKNIQIITIESMLKLL